MMEPTECADRRKVGWKWAATFAARVLFAVLLLGTAWTTARANMMQSFADSAAIESGTRGYLRYPDIHGDRVVFSSSGDLWLAPVAGGVATRITSHEGDERFAKFSPDGRWIAFSGDYYGNEDVYVMPVDGGKPRQLTYDNARDEVIGWDRQGRVLFRSDRIPPYRAAELYAVDVNGGFPVKLPYLRASWLALEPDGPRQAMVIENLGFHNWNLYKGGRAEKIWIGDPTVPEFNLVTHYAGNESFPMWNGNGRIYFVMDSTGIANLWSMEPDGGGLKQETFYTDYGVRWPSMHDGRIVFQHAMDLSVYDVADGSTTPLDIVVPTDLYVERTKYVDPNSYLVSWTLDPEGKRLVVEARGEIFTLPVHNKGLIRQWTYSSGSREKEPHFLPGSDGAVLGITDATGEERLVRYDKAGANPVEIETSPLNDWKYNFKVSPDGKMLAYADGNQVLYLVDLAKGKRTKIEKGGWEFNEYVWSPDSRYLAYVRESGEDETAYLKIYDTKTGESHLISDTRFNTFSPAWDPDGRYLYCVTSRNFNAYQDYSRGLFFYDRTGTLALYRLRADVPSPFLARGDDAGDGLPAAPWMEKEEKGKKKDKDEVQPIVIEFNGLADRMEPFPERPGNYGSLSAVKDKVYFVETQSAGMAGQQLRGYEGPTLRLYDLASRKSDAVASRVSGYELSSDGSTLVIRSGKDWYWGDAGAPSLKKDGDHTISTDGWKLEVNPSREWAQILREAWRQQREFFYSANMHGVDWDAVFAKYAPFVKRITTREDVQDVIRMMESELHTGHAYIGPGDEPKVPSDPIGKLGVDLEPDPASGYYRITRVLAPEPGTADGVSPLVIADPATGPGTYLLAVNGRPVQAGRNVLRLFQDQAGREVALTLNEKPSMEGSREVVVKTLRNERQLRYLDWVRGKREYVSKQSGGKLGYFQLPDMGAAGLRQFGRDYYPQRLLPGMIVDDRFNAGGNVSEYIIKEMTTPIFALQESRYGGFETKPHGAYYGHIAVLINGATSSDGETLAYATKALKFGTLIGERTWGGWVWIWPRRPLVDNAYISVPEFGGWGMNGKWIVEGHGVSPEVEVMNDPASEIQGKDPQLDRAITILLKQIAEQPRNLPPKPADRPAGE